MVVAFFFGGGGALNSLWFNTIGSFVLLFVVVTPQVLGSPFSKGNTILSLRGEQCGFKAMQFQSQAEAPTPCTAFANQVLSGLCAQHVVGPLSPCKGTQGLGKAGV